LAKPKFVFGVVAMVVVVIGVVVLIIAVIPYLQVPSY